jgi:hypothetical protein
MASEYAKCKNRDDDSHAECVIARFGDAGYFLVMSLPGLTWPSIFPLKEFTSDPAIEV